MKRRKIASPDRADAVCLCLATDNTTMRYGVSSLGAWARPLKRNIKGVV